MPSLETFEIRFLGADFCCAVGFRPHLGIKFEPISEIISVPLVRLNAENSSSNLSVGRSITYSTEDDVSNSKIFLQLLEKNDFGEFQNIGTGECSLSSGSFEGPVWFVSVYDRGFELGTIEVSAQILIKKPRYNPLKKVKTRGSKKSGRKSTSGSKSKSRQNRPKTAPHDVLDLSLIQKTPRDFAPLSVACGAEDVGAVSNPPPLFYRAAVSARGGWQQSDETARIVDLLKNGTGVKSARVMPPKPRGDARLFKVKPDKASPASLKECPLVTQIIEELNSLNCRFTEKHESSIVHEVTQSDAIRSLKEYNKATRLSSPVPLTHYDAPRTSPCSTGDESDRVSKSSVIPVVTRRLSNPNIKSRSNTSLRQSSSRIRQEVHSGTYDRYGRPTLKPVYSGLFKNSSVDASLSVQSLVSLRAKSVTTQTKLEMEMDLKPEVISEPEVQPGQKSASTQTNGDAGLRQQTVLSVDICGRDAGDMTHTPRASPAARNHSTVTSVHISMPSVASETVTSMSQTSVQYSDDFTDEDDETDAEKSRSETPFKMIPQRSKSPVMNWRMLE